MISVRISVLLSFFSNDLYTSLQVAFEATSANEEVMRADAIRGFWNALIIFGILATIYISQVMLDRNPPRFAQLVRTRQGYDGLGATKLQAAKETLYG